MVGLESERGRFEPVEVKGVVVDMIGMIGKWKITGLDPRVLIT